MSLDTVQMHIDLCLCAYSVLRTVQYDSLVQTTPPPLFASVISLDRPGDRASSVIYIPLVER